MPAAPAPVTQTNNISSTALQKDEVAGIAQEIKQSLTPPNEQELKIDRSTPATSAANTSNDLVIDDNGNIKL